MISFNSYSKIYAMGHRAVQNLLAGSVIIEEKVDGSQFSFGLDEEGELHFRSKGAVMLADAPEKMFAKGVEFVKSIKTRLIPGWTYRGEYLAKPKHNALAYDRVPHGHIILFDIATGREAYMSREGKEAEAQRLGMEIVPLLFKGFITLDMFRKLLDTTSVLGGQKIEGVVVKPADYDVFDVDKKVLMGKFVSEAFKEVHSTAWKTENPWTGDFLRTLGAKYTTAARWGKAVQHLAEAGEITDTPQDIPKILRDVKLDVEHECKDEIMAALWGYAWPYIQRDIIRGLPEWYKEQLLKKSFESSAVV